MSTKPSRISNDDIRVFADGLSMFFRESNEPGDLKLDLDRVLEALNVDVLRVQGMESSLVDEDIYPLHDIESQKSLYDKPRDRSLFPALQVTSSRIGEIAYQIRAW
ncbi:hypothetical protein H3S87_02505 [Bifidobacterium sp. W8108]|uniref:hypothetical protein n=1 Tax=unclassified Bifidobacterium TaxID=2608897 RepID=UPI0018DE4E5D|nr:MULTISPECIES: hypothetical protein [unclassified Bifidobacterium]MBH9978539.1 hypothetical protein [Bifidobacterium sp. W8108]MBI0173591.1 hypothetical protein [Bifidobacterium sp. M0307]